MNLDRPRHRVGWRPAACNAPAKRGVVDAGALCPFSQTCGGFAHRKQSVRRPVSLLLRLGRPATVCRTAPIRALRAVAAPVSAVVVHPVDRVLRRGSRPHVSKEGLERAAPRGANRDASTTVIGVICRRPPCAPPDHRPPNPVLTGVAAPVFLRQRRRPAQEPVARELPKLAPARQSLASSKSNTAHDNCLSAAACTSPQRNGPARMPYLARPLDHQKPTESAPGEVYNLSHRHLLVRGGGHVPGRHNVAGTLVFSTRGAR
jgi:hypothetical protein